MTEKEYLELIAKCNLAADVSDTTVEDANTYTILSLCDQLVDAIDVYLEDQEDCKSES